MRPIPSDRVNGSAFPILMKKLGILHEPATEFERRALAYLKESCHLAGGLRIKPPQRVVIEPHW